MKIAIVHDWVQAYAGAERVLEQILLCYPSADLFAVVDFLPDDQRNQVEGAERRVVASFAEAIVALRPDLQARQLHKPLTMLLFGMINWTFTWLRPDGALTYDALGDMIADLFCGGLPQVAR